MKKEKLNIKLILDLLSSMTIIDAKSIRDKAIIALNFLTQLRITDICRLRFNDFVIINNIIYIDKGYPRIKILNLHPVIYTCIIEHLEFLKANSTERNPLFYKSFRPHIYNEHVTYSNDTNHYHYMLAKRCYEAGFQKITPSEIRNYGFKYALSKARTVEEVMAIIHNSGKIVSTSITSLYDMKDNQHLNQVLSNFENRFLDETKTELKNKMKCGGNDD